MEITEELIQTIYKRANEFCIAKYGKEPDRFQIFSDGICAIWTDYEGCEKDSEYITGADLTADLDEVAKEREILLEKERIAREKYNNEQRIKNEEYLKGQRKADYLRLKKEFEE